MIQLSQAAISEISRMQTKYRTPSPVLRVSVKAGGCADFYYTLDFSETSQASDLLVEREDIQIAIDPQSYPYLNGLTIDYSEDLMGGGFRFHNPNATKTCGCGISFAITDSPQ